MENSKWKSLGYILLGECQIRSTNQVGEAIRYDSRKGFVGLSRRASQFCVYSVNFGTSARLEDFRESSSLPLILGVNGKILTICKDSHRVRVEDIPPDGPPTNAILRYFRGKLGRNTVSFSPVDFPDYWLRHSNSRIIVCNLLYILRTTSSSTLLILGPVSMRTHLL